MFVHYLCLTLIVPRDVHGIHYIRFMPSCFQRSTCYDQDPRRMGGLGWGGGGGKGAGKTARTLISIFIPLTNKNDDNDDDDRQIMS